MFYMAKLPQTEVAEDHGDAGLMISNSGQEDPLQDVSSVQQTEATEDPSCPCWRPPILRNEEGRRQGKARQDTKYRVVQKMAQSLWHHNYVNIRHKVTRFLAKCSKRNTLHD